MHYYFNYTYFKKDATSFHFPYTGNSGIVYSNTYEGLSKTLDFERTFKFLSSSIREGCLKVYSL